MITKIRQTNSKWSSVKLGPSDLNVGGHGCTTCSLCMALEKLRGFFCNPGYAARNWVYTKGGLIIWTETDFKGMKFIKRGYDYNIHEIADYTNFEDTAAIIEVKIVSNGKRHWLYCDSVNEGVISVIDPIDGKYYENVPAKYQVIGYALFRKTNIMPNKDYISDWAVDGTQFCMDNKILDNKDWQLVVTKEQLAVALHRFDKYLNKQ